MFRALCSSSGGQNSIVQHLVSSHWSKITKIPFSKYERIVVKFMCEFFGCDYCILLTINVLCHVEITFIQSLDLLKGYLKTDWLKGYLKKRLSNHVV